MPAYRFFPRADAAQDKIWRDTCDRWGSSQADQYIRGLHAHLAKLCGNRALWRLLPQRLAVPEDVRRQAWFSRFEHHYVFFRELDNGDLGVMSILHERMDVPARLKADLDAFATRND